MTNEAKAKGELAMMGIAVPVINNKEAIEITDYVLGVFRNVNPAMAFNETGTQVLDERINKFGKNNVKYMVVNVMMGDMNCITYCLEEDAGDEDAEPFPEDLTTEDGVFSYVLNTTVEYFSELGYTFYEKKKNGQYHRVG